MKHIIKTSVLLGLFMGTVGSASAQEVTPYIGIGYGQTTVDSGISNVTGSGDLDEGGSDGKFFIGADVAENFAVEFEYFNVSSDSVELRLNSGDTFKFDGTTYAALVNGVKINAEGQIYAVSGRYNHRVGNNGTLFGRFGFANWDIDINASAPGLGTDTDNRSGTDLMFGLGASYDINRSVVIGVQYEHIQLSDGLDSIAYLTGDIAYRF